MYKKWQDDLFPLIAGHLLQGNVSVMLNLIVSLEIMEMFLI